MPRWIVAALDCVLPRDCEGCELPLAAGHDGCLCAACAATIVEPSPACTTCGVPLLHAVACCAECLRSTPAFSTARALGLYLSAQAGLNPLAHAIQGLKYRRRRVVADALGVLLARRYPFAAGALIVPVPLHLDRLRARGFNQALLLGRTLGRRRGLDVAVDALRRRRDTPGQAGLDAATRRRNLRDAFVADARSVRGRAVVLVDDVLTTGATADACARALRDAGAARVDVFTVGRTPPPVISARLASPRRDPYVSDI